MFKEQGGNWRKTDEEKRENDERGTKKEVSKVKMMQSLIQYYNHNHRTVTKMDTPDLY